ncbi:HAMP domain-containing sensor histidine kinase [Aquisalimonas asiatica]|uniref:histidine kinase n=1 Tax=Aquisalimonas asiatica TaxID=406100 RepID=A0A1H8U0M4_9GAMM|nr:ATP-binding protein [Aquisalimonas asiatica]SEO96789.1 two-component system, NtrC family, sensor histidine kinase GlrK [Aquisalimonas asiatica]
MSLYQPKSTLKLILYGFGFVSLPLIIALGYAGLYVDRLANQSQHAVYQAVQAITASRQLIDLVTTMERSGRQYLILEEPEFLENVEDAHEEFQETAQRLHRLPLDEAHRERVDDLIDAERYVYEQISGYDGGETDQIALARQFMELTQLGQDVLSGSNRMVDREVRTMQETATRAQQLLFWLAVALGPLTIVSVGFFTTLIARPIRQLDRIIRRMGTGDFQQPIQVAGPQDLQYVGERLDWLRQRLLDLEEQKARFLRHVSHELKTPLTAIREGADLLEDSSVGRLNAEQQEIARILASNTQQLQHLIEDLLNFSTARDTAMAMDIKRTRLAPLIEEVARNHKPAMLSKDLQLETELQDIHIRADAEKLRTIVDNLLSNAVKFSPTGGRIHVGLTRDGDGVALTVADEGPGIEADEQDAVFDAFFQGSIRAEGYVKGSGLGLSIAKDYAEAHGGSINLESPGQAGTRIRVDLPLNAGSTSQ